MNDVVIAITNVPDRDTALLIAHTLVERGLAACVNVLEACDSVYRWQGKIEHAREVPLLIKTRATRYAEVEAVIRGLHPYELPEIVAVRVEHGFPAYLQWVAAQTVEAVETIEPPFPPRPAADTH